LGSNRRLESILRALAAFRERHRFQLDIYGTIWDEQYILGLVKKLGLQRLVRVHGYVSEAELDRAIASAHLSFNLRFPTMGEASGSVLRSWNSATPVLVTDEAWYHALPQSVAYKISATNELEDIQTALKRLIETPVQFERYGIAGYEYARLNHDPDQYVTRLKRAFENIRQLELRFSANFMMRSVSSKLSSQTILLDNAADKVASVFGC
jgi:glycosyltransferase involved in cell wall biosynthesis